jgi:hypothetical protein
VRVIDQTGTDVDACLLHGAVLLASLDHGRWAPFHGPEGSTIAAHTRAPDLPSFDFMLGGV